MAKCSKLNGTGIGWHLQIVHRQDFPLSRLSPLYSNRKELPEAPADPKPSPDDAGGEWRR
jgi:hypothetical protein